MSDVIGRHHFLERPLSLLSSAGPSTIHLVEPPPAILVLSTCPREKSAELAELLVRERVAACVNVIEEVESFYFWDGKLNRDLESLLVVKTAPDRLPALRAVLLGAHPYQVPEVIEVPITGGNDRYLEWVLASTRPAEGARGA